MLRAQIKNQLANLIDGDDRVAWRKDDLKHMSGPYNIFLKQPVHESLRRLKGSKKQAIEKSIDYLPDHPFEGGDFSESDDAAADRFTVKSSKITLSLTILIMQLRNLKSYNW